MEVVDALGVDAICKAARGFDTWPVSVSALGRYCTWLVSSVQASDYINTPGVYNGTICSVVSLLVWSRTIAHHAHCCCSAGCVSVQLLHCLGNLPHSFGDKVEQEIYAGRQHDGQA